MSQQETVLTKTMNISVEMKDGDQLDRIKAEGGEVEIYLDNEGLDFLLSQLSFLKNRKTDHVHLMTSAWGGCELTEGVRNTNSLPVHHLRVLLVNG